MAAPFHSAKTSRQPRRHVRACGREYVETPYRPSYALGIICADEADQAEQFRRLRAILPNHELKVLVI